MSSVRTIAFDARKIADFGIGTYVRGLVGALPPLLRDEELVLLGDRRVLEQTAEPIRSLRSVDERSPLYSLRELRGLTRSARRAGADLLHVPHYTMPVGCRCPVVVTIHDLIHPRFPEHRTPLHSAYARWMVGRALRRAAAVITVSEASKRDLVARFGSAAQRVVAIHNGIEERFFVPVPQEQLDRHLASWQLAPGYLLFVGNPLPHKNLSTLLEAFARLRQELPAPPPLVLAGSRGAQIALLRSQVEGAGLGGSVRILPHLPADQLPSLYAGASLLLIPSLWEGFGLPAAEAMAAGVPVVAADRGGLPEIVGEAAELVDPTSAEQLAARVAGLLGSRHRLRELSRLGRERALRFRWAESARRTLELYRAQLAAVERRAAREGRL